MGVTAFPIGILPDYQGRSIQHHRLLGYSRVEKHYLGDYIGGSHENVSPND